MAETVTSWTNETWVAALRARDEAALSDLRAYLCRCLDKVLAGRGAQGHAEDFAQQALTRVLDRLERFRGDSAFTTWASAIAVRVALTELRRKRWGDISLDALLADGATIKSLTAHTTNAEHAAHREMLDALREGIAETLTERQRAVVLAELSGMPSSVLAEQTGMKPNAIYKMHHDARKRLRRHLEDRGFTVEDLRFALNGVTEAP